MRPPVIPRLTLDTKIDILFEDINILIYQPSIEEIGLIGESSLLIGLNALTRDYKKIEQIKDNSDSSNISNFDILMSIINEKSDTAKIVKQNVQNVLFLVLPKYKIFFTPRSILLQDIDNKEVTHTLDAQSFDNFTNILYDMFCLALAEGTTGKVYNPQGDRARALVEKFEKKRKLLADMRKQRGEDTELQSLYGRYIDILAVGEHKDKNTLKKYSVFQLMEEFKRFQLKEEFDYTFQAKMAGATKIKDAKNWMDDIHFNDDVEN